MVVFTPPSNRPEPRGPTRLRRGAWRPLLLAATILLAGSTLSTSLSTSAFPRAAAQREWTVDPQSIFALLTQKGGFAKGRAHDHVIAADDFTANLDWNGDPSRATFSLTIEARDLAADPEDLRRRLAPRFEELGLREGDLPPIETKQRADIRETMLGRKQLHADRFPTISVELVAVRKEASRAGAVDLTHAGTISFAAHGRTVELPFRALLTETDESLTIEAVAPLRFTQIGIEPYSAFLGAVKNLDEVTLYLNLIARPRAPEVSSLR